MRSQASVTVAVTGAGIAGLSAAHALRKIGVNVQVFESAPVIKPVGAGLLLAANALQGFERLGIADQVARAGKGLPRFSILDRKGDTLSSLDAARVSERYGLHNFAIHRADLHRVLLSQLPEDIVHTGKRTIGVDDRNAGAVTLHFDDGTWFVADYLIAADGIHSPVRRQLLPESRPRYAGYTCWRAAVEAPAGLLATDCATETWGKNGRFGIVPLAGNKVYWFATVDAPEKDPEKAAYRVADLQNIFADYHHDVRKILAATRDEDLLHNDICDIKPLSRFAFDRILLVGDAAHATTPNMGQGACQAVEDAAVLLDEWPKNANPADAFRAFERRRIPRANFVIRRSRQIGVMAQSANPMIAFLRDTMMKLTPEGVNEAQIMKVLKVDF